ncbi:hypothetical protein KG091_00625 [Carnobacteriaceae bacterium zg-ZUI78]|nr:hypothetical protein [Carnobacteriaceae bacterium zg-ZUI78]
MDMNELLKNLGIGILYCAGVGLCVTILIGILIFIFRLALIGFIFTLFVALCFGIYFGVVYIGQNLLTIGIPIILLLTGIVYMIYRYKQNEEYVLSQSLYKELEERKQREQEERLKEEKVLNALTSLFEKQIQEDEQQFII